MNIRSLNANFDKLNELFTNYVILPDIIAISETKLKLSQVYNAKLRGYHFYHKGTTTSRGRIGLLVKETLSISICKELDLNIPNCENMWTQLDLGNNKKCIVGVIYSADTLNWNYQSFAIVLNQPLKNWIVENCCVISEETSMQIWWKVTLIPIQKILWI